MYSLLSMYYGPWVTEQSQFLTQRRLQITFYLCTCASRSSALPASQIPYCTILYYMVLYSPPFNDIIVLFGQLYSDKCRGDNVRCSWGVGLSRSLLGSGRATIGKRVDAILAQSSFLSLSAALPYVQRFWTPTLTHVMWNTGFVPAGETDLSWQDGVLVRSS